MLCHTDPEQINRILIKLYEFSDADVYIHVDRNHPEIRNRIQQLDNKFLLPEERSFCIQWGGINIVKATLQLIREVRDSAKSYDYIWLISGQDYPIVPVKKIENRLAATLGMNYIDTILPGDAQYNWYKKLYEIAYPLWINQDNIPVKAIKRLYKLVTGGYTHTFKLFVRKKPFDYDFVFGSQWWTLTSKVAFEILQYNDDHPKILDYYTNTIIPDESFFQTLFMIVRSNAPWQHSLTFSYSGTSRRHTAVLREYDYDSVQEVSRKCCFARKFDSGSYELVRRIEDDGKKSDEKD